MGRLNLWWRRFKRHTITMNVACILLSVYIALHGGVNPARANIHPISAITRETTTQHINTATQSDSNSRSIDSNSNQISSSSSSSSGSSNIRTTTSRGSSKMTKKVKVDPICFLIIMKGAIVLSRIYLVCVSLRRLRPWRPPCSRWRMRPCRRSSGHGKPSRTRSRAPSWTV